jgi:hypothetical protein
MGICKVSRIAEQKIKNYKVVSDKLSPAINKYMKTAVASEELVLTKGKELSGTLNY